MMASADNVELQPLENSQTEESLPSSDSKRSAQNSVGIVLHSLRALVCLDPTDADIRAIAVIVICWVLATMWILAGWMGPGVRELIFTLPVATSVLTWPFVLLYCILGRSGSAMILWSSKYCCCIIAGLCALNYWAYAPMINDESFPGYLLVWVLAPIIYAVHWLLERLWRALYRQTREDDPSPIFWQRLDNCFVNLIRVIGVLIAISYVAGLVFMSIEVYEDVNEYLDMSYSYLWEILAGFTIASLAFASLMYFVVATLVVSDGPIRDSPHHGNRVMRRTKQFVMNPSDPLGEPLLLV